ncbi:uncharacterized protein Triagg1_9232 [Trichoderma aggressivum f. europaeum]|uniref:Uncharacterized protein n=1 Tax=Trichoderma aggressivum f. europaeum TaxID=173218 RepID=A0AAE1I8Y9_9HYPO|nr:hypothetical protein Triagg1_9232 [Trichoderma aggressivum f. europaeum]
MDLAPDTKGLIQPMGQTPTSISNLQQDVFNPTFKIEGLGNLPGMNQVGLENHLQLHGMNPTTSPTSILQAPGPGQAFALPGYQNQNPFNDNSMSFLQSFGPIHTSSPANLLQPFETNQTLNNTNFLQSSGMNQIPDQTNFLQSPEMNQIFNQADPMPLYGMNWGINAMGYQQQFGMNPNLGSMGHQQLQMSLNQVPTGVSAGLFDSSTAFASAPSCINYLPTPPPTSPESSTPFSINQHMSPNVDGTMNQWVNTSVALPQEFALPVGNSLHNLAIGSGIGMNIGMIPCQEMHLPAQNWLPDFTNMGMNANLQHPPVSSGVQNMSTGSGMNMNVNFLQQTRCAATKGLQKPSVGNGIPRQSQAQLPRTIAIKQASREVKKAKNQALGPQHPGPTRIKKTLNGNTASSLDNRLTRYDLIRRVTPNMTNLAPTISPKLRAAMDAAIANGAKAVAQTAILGSSTVSQNSSQSTQAPAEQKVKVKIEPHQHAAFRVAQRPTQQVPQPLAQMPLQQSAQQAIQNAVRRTVQQATQMPNQRPAQKLLSKPMISPPVEQQAQREQRPIQQPVQQPVRESIEQQPTQQTGFYGTPPAIPLDDLLTLLSDKHWEFWHRLDAIQMRQLMALTLTEADIHQAWRQRLCVRVKSNDFVRVYELGGFLYEVHGNPSGGFKGAIAIDMRQYAGLLARFRPKCCNSLDYAQALAAAKARAEGKDQPEFDDLDQAQAMSDGVVRCLGLPSWWEIARLQKQREERIKDLIFKGEVEGKKTKK